jgi:hypothetical protein
MRSPPLGRLLVDTGALTSAALDAVLEAQRGSGKRLGDLLVERGLVRAEQLAQLLSNQLGVPWVRLARTTVDPAVLALVPVDVAFAHHVLPIYVRQAEGARCLYVAADDPTDAVALAACARAAGVAVKPVVALAGDLRAAIVKAYGEPPPGARVRASLTPLARGEVEELAASSRRRRATILALNAPTAFLRACSEAVAADGGVVVDGSLVRAAELAREHQPCALVVTEDVYAFDSEALERLALDHDAALVAWNEDASALQLAPLLASAISRAARTGYEPGVVVDGRYELLRELDSPVPWSRWEVRHVRTARRCLLELGLGDAELASGLRATQTALARVTHPGAPELRDAAGSDAGDPYLVLELVEGRSLDALLTARGTLTTSDACAVGVQTCDVLAAAHAAGVAHRDVRLANLLVARDAWGAERVKLVGWARATRAPLGEPAASAEVQHDVAALAACVVELARGREGASGESAIDDVRARADAGAFDALGLARALADAVPDAAARSSLLEPLGGGREGEGAPSGRPPGESEQRRFPRAPYRTPVRLEVPGFGALDGRTEDISVGGLLVVARAQVLPGTKVNVRFALPVDGRVVSEPAIVKWTRAARHDDATGLSTIGVELAAIAPDTLAQVERWVGFVGEDAVR